MTAPTYTPEDVARLVDVVAEIVRVAEEQPMRQCIVRTDSYAKQDLYINLTDALAPFRPDPDAELIEAMARAMWDSGCASNWQAAADVSRTRYLDEARAALAAFRAHTEAK